MFLQNLLWGVDVCLIACTKTIFRMWDAGNGLICRFKHMSSEVIDAVSSSSEDDSDQARVVPAPETANVASSAYTWLTTLSLTQEVQR